MRETVSDVICAAVLQEWTKVHRFYGQLFARLCLIFATSFFDEVHNSFFKALSNRADPIVLTKTEIK
jgi:hypothetical protein